MFLQASRDSVSQLSEKTEATLSRFNALLCQLPVERFDDHWNLNAETHLRDLHGSFLTSYLFTKDC